MDNSQNPEMSHGFRPRMEYPPPTFSSQNNAQHYFQGHIPTSSSQFQRPPPPPNQPTLGTFHSGRFTEDSYLQPPSMPASAFHGHRMTTPNFSCPPPSFPGPGIRPSREGTAAPSFPGHGIRPSREGTAAPSFPGHGIRPSREGTAAPSFPGHGIMPFGEGTAAPSFPGYGIRPSREGTAAPSFPGHGIRPSREGTAEMQEVARMPPQPVYGPYYQVASQQNCEVSATNTTLMDFNNGMQQQDLSSGSSHPVPSGYNFSEPSQSMSSACIASQSPVRSKKTDVMMWLKSFEQEILQRSHLPKENVTTKKKLKLAEVQEMMSRSRNLMKQLLQLEEEMRSIGAEAEEQTWLDLVKQVEKRKMELAAITRIFNDRHFVDKVLLLISQRRKKRERTRRQKKVKVKQRKELKEKWKREEEKIDAWREKLRQREEEERRERAVKSEADSILGEVHQKQSDVVKMQQLLENLISLRITRLNKGAAHGFISTPQQDQVFNTTLKSIGEVLNTQMKEYKLEEQTLRVMMEESTSCRRSNADKDSKDAIAKLEQSLRKVLFGDMAPISQEAYEEQTAANRSLETLIERRREWDQYICTDDSPLASSIPLSWVVPPAEPSPAWAQYRS